MGVPYQGFNEEVRKVVLGSTPPPEDMENLDQSCFKTTANELEEKIGRVPTEYEVISYKLYPKVWMDYKLNTRPNLVESINYRLIYSFMV